MNISSKFFPENTREKILVKLDKEDFVSRIFKAKEPRKKD
jgi:hypothetical protein